jgi:hypothetical protein
MKFQKFKFSKNPNYYAITQLSQNSMYIEIICILAILQISNSYPKNKNPTSQPEKWGLVISS